MKRKYISKTIKESIRNAMNQFLFKSILLYFSRKIIMNSSMEILNSRLSKKDYKKNQILKKIDFLHIFLF